MASLYGRYSLLAALKLLFISAFFLLLLCQSNEYIIKKVNFYFSDYLSDNGEEDSSEDDFEFISLFPAKIYFTLKAASHCFIPANFVSFFITRRLYRLHCIYRL